MTRLGLVLGGRIETFAGLAGMGDLVLTCTGALSRNRTVGVLLGQGQTLEDILRDAKFVAEGVKTSKSAQAARRAASDRDADHATRCTACSTKTRARAWRVQRLMTRALKSES